MYRIEFVPSAYREYKKLPQNVRPNIADIIEELQGNPFSRMLDVKKLKKPLSGYRLRIGEYRVLYTIGQNLVTIYRIRHRKDAYK